ncbi:YfcE family phosphodiesterase [Bythopirellula polymerisocia]|uniref:Phosphoesterase n=1 Tax=Bythopirellula polymerisocia TaxID=2528003 RepID=A0A5C6D370_9BACT|nr:YfcE family phosphodiesterase [Bythopirellula polymerisocia]TWU30097.1 phosphodiesterase [Bythopirellula polymerisocia]
MRIGVVSDTHAHVANTQAAINLLESLAVERVLHCGDVCSTVVAKLFISWPTDFVFGNCDYDREELADAISSVGQTCHAVFGDLEIAGRRIALLHSDDHRKFLEVTQGGIYDLVCYGHTHVAKIEQIGPTLVLNPGALYRANPHSLAVVDLETMVAEIINL